jgi:hypothetical protein
MKSSKHVTSITPTLAKDVSFSDKVEAVDAALRTRASVEKEIKAKWVGVVRVLSKYDIKAPGRRVDAGQAANLVQDLVVYKPKTEVAPVFQQILAAGHSYELNNVTTNSSLVRLIDSEVKGFKKFVENYSEAKAASNESLIKDDAKTKEARAELQATVNEYLKALESYDDTVTSVANVKEYISIVKDIADISAIAQGVKVKE